MIKKISKQMQQGKVYSINSKKHIGHKGEITKKQHNGEIYVVIYTHSNKTFEKKNIPLHKNLDVADKRKAYMLTKTDRIKPKHIGKKHNSMKMSHPVDKSIKRHLTKKRKG